MVDELKDGPRPNENTVRCVAVTGRNSAQQTSYTAAQPDATGLPSASQFAATFLLGCTRGGSPGIFG